MSSSIYLPPEVWIHIFEFDMTYKLIYDRVMMELELKWFIVKTLELEMDISDIWHNHDLLDLMDFGL